MVRKLPSQIKDCAIGESSIDSFTSQSTNSDHPSIKGEQETLEDVRITQYDPLIPPNQLSHSLPIHPLVHSPTIRKSRIEIQNIIEGRSDDRILCVVGPCSIHDVNAGLEYASRLSSLRQELSKDLCIVMRTYFEKPRTTVGWKGLLYDPFLDGSCRINTGLNVARKFLLDVVAMGLPVGCELLDTISPQYIGDLISWGAIGARTTESQIHRQLASGVSFSVGFKNGTDGNIGIAMDAIVSASNPHSFLGVTHQGLAAITKTTGNEFCHVILRGSSTGTNYDCESVQKVASKLKERSLSDFVMIDCSHGNSSKDYRNQPLVLDDICDSILGGKVRIGGIMIESNLIAGKQALTSDPSDLIYGQSITDGCVDWETTEKMLRKLAETKAKSRQLKNS